MKNKTGFICCICLIVGLMVGFLAIYHNVVKKKEVSSLPTTDEIKTMDGMDYLSDGNTYGYYFDVTKGDAEGKMTEAIYLDHYNDALRFKIESAGEKREIAVQFFVDYEQVPVIIDNKTYYTYFFTADEKYSKEQEFCFADEIDENKNHKLTAAMTVYADKHETDSNDKYCSNVYSIAYNMDIVFSDKADLCDSSYKTETVDESYQDMWEGALLNTDYTDYKRKLPDKIINAKAGEEIPFIYHIGGFEDCGNYLFMISMGMEQTDIDEKKYLYFNERTGDIVRGKCKIKAPDQKGLYDITGWVIKNPFQMGNGGIFRLTAIWRFTLAVE